MFPKLRVINGVELRTAEQIAQQALAANSGNPIPQNGPDFRDMNGIGENFLLEFFAAYDSNRQELANKYYDESSQFSLAVDAVSVRDPNAPLPIPWQSYLKASRNLTKITTQNAKIQRLFKGANVIGQMWNSLPATRHPNIKEELSKYIMDCHPLTGLADPSGQNQMGVDGLIICVHGEFEEHDQKTDRLGKRSFSRSFVLGPGLPGQGPIRVLSDMLSLRAFSTLPNVFVAATQQPSEPPNQQQAMIAELSRQTNMVPEYSKMCLEQVNWDFNQAVIMFQEKKVCSK
jgi:nuclear RNA export factor